MPKITSQINITILQLQNTMSVYFTYLSTRRYDIEKTVQGNKPEADSVLVLLAHPSSSLSTSPTQTLPSKTHSYSALMLYVTHHIIIITHKITYYNKLEGPSLPHISPATAQWMRVNLISGSSHNMLKSVALRWIVEAWWWRQCARTSRVSDFNSVHHRMTHW